MTGVLEAGALVAALGAVVRSSRKERQLEEEAAARSIYRRHFHADILELAPDRASVVAGSLPTGLDNYAAACVRAVEKYQEERRQWFMGISSGAEPVGDVRTRVLEELKQWLLTLTEGSADASAVSTRLDYCWQYLLRPAVFETRNERSFLQTMAAVCRQLEGLLRQTAASQRDGFKQIGRILSLGRELAQATLAVLAHALPDPASTFPGLAGAGAGAGAGGAGEEAGGHVRPEELIAAACSAEEEDEQTARLVNFGSEAGQVLRSLLRTPHFGALAGSDEDLALDNPVAARGGARHDAPESAAFARTVDRTRGLWSGTAAGSSSGLLEAFRTPRHAGVRVAYLDLCCHVDRFVFFLAALHPYHHLASTAGDIAMCWLRQYLSHLLQELEKVLLQLRQARLQVVRAAQKQLQEAAKRGPKNISGTELRWMQGLRHIDETKLDKLHRSIISQCTEMLAATTLTRELDMRAEAQKGLRDVAAAFQSADFQARCTVSLPEGLLDDARQLGALAAPDGSLAPALPSR